MDRNMRCLISLLDHKKIRGFMEVELLKKLCRLLQKKEDKLLTTAI